MIVMRVGEPRASPRYPGEAAMELGPEPVEVIVAHLVNGDEDDEGRRRGGAVICFGRGLVAGTRPSPYPKE